MDQEPKKKKKKTKEQIVINCSDSQYPVIRYVGRKMLSWIVNNEPEGPWDVWWCDGAVFSDLLGSMQPYQKVNHFPGMYSLARKNHLGKNLSRMAKQFPQSYNYFPQTWLLPAELSDFRTQIGKQRTFILKPEASCQGKGILLVKDAENISINEHYVAQRYLSKPYLIDGLKFDLRIYVLLAGCDPLRIYIYKEGLARFATETYKKPAKDNLDNICMHLTNYAVNKDNDNFIFNEDAAQMDVGHKRSMSSVFQLLQEKGENVALLWHSIKKMMIKTFCAVQPILQHQYKSCQAQNYMNNMCFEILGMDVILDHKLKPYLLEVNHSPSFTTDTPLDSQIKRDLISQTLILMNISSQTKNQIIQEQRKNMQQRVLTGKQVKLTIEQKQALIAEGQRARDIWEDAHLGNYEKIYPLPELDDDYDRYIAYAQVLYQQSTGANVKRTSAKKQSDLPKTESNKSEITKSESKHTDSKLINNRTLQVPLKRVPLQSFKKETASTTHLPYVEQEDPMPRFKIIQKKSTIRPDSSVRRVKVMSQGNFVTPKIFTLQP